MATPTLSIVSLDAYRARKAAPARERQQELLIQTCRYMLREAEGGRLRTLVFVAEVGDRLDMGAGGEADRTRSLALATRLMHRLARRLEDGEDEE